ncbi:MAG: sigma-54-dependent Fis family transcriptional regulator [Rhodoferax sp.]|uniref:sigma-54 dependent transcriptional regulator n=1 Tax=Rhodoferax sp. TaxID=50421 RepID=UPI0013FF3AFD|nr:sigma-54 dependent transcriptional regulator [Rhodoferax sp.]NDP39230.1 sigma-54-dependent Fis family transcriptional regulator [Rhodoferax sp.]
MPLRKLLSVTLGDQQLLSAPAELLSSWQICPVDNLAAARKALAQHPYPVGLLLLNNTSDADVMKVDALLDAHQSTQWVGVFPAEMIKRPPYRALIVQHLFDFHTWPIDPVRLNHTLGHAFGYAELEGPPDTTCSGKRDMKLIGQSAAMQHLRKQIVKVAQTSAPVLIWGESGSGKELTARAIHNCSPRASAPFIAVNCGAIAASLIQSELFGYERGAFTGAAKEKQGLIESAAGGTLFLDEVGDLPLELQTNLLRFLQERTITRVGASRSIEVDARVIAASHTRLAEAVKAGLFREDLLYRLNVIPLTVPALRERKEDLELLVRHFFIEFAQDKNPRLTGFSNRAMLAIKAHDWPGNVRELINRIRRAMVMSEGRLITPEDLDLASPNAPEGPNEPPNGEALEEARIRAERDAIHVCLQGSGRNISRAARDLGISRMTLYRLMDKHGITP